MKWFSKVVRNYANFQGRARRKEYWMFFLFNLIFTYGMLFLGTFLLHNLVLYVIYVLAMLIPSIAVAVRRMHDVNKSGWFCLIPIYNLILCCTPGTEGENSYGYDPKEDGPSFDFEKNPQVN